MVEKMEVGKKYKHRFTETTIKFLGISESNPREFFHETLVGFGPFKVGLDSTGISVMKLFDEVIPPPPPPKIIIEDRLVQVTANGIRLPFDGNYNRGKIRIRHVEGHGIDVEVLSGGISPEDKHRLSALPEWNKL